jgi:hypothetical protein
MPVWRWWWYATRGPSAWPRRAGVIVLAYCGACVSGYLAFYQYRLIGSVWDPVFGDGSRQVLDSAFSRSLPVHDAALGAGAYLAELVLTAVGGSRRWQRRPYLVVAVGLLSLAMGATALVLLVVQAAVVHAFCGLCLVSAAISLSLPVLVLDEVRAAVRQVRYAAPLPDQAAG